LTKINSPASACLVIDISVVVERGIDICKVENSTAIPVRSRRSAIYPRPNVPGKTGMLDGIETSPVTYSTTVCINGYIIFKLTVTDKNFMSGKEKCPPAQR